MNSLLSAVVPMTVEISKTFRSLFGEMNRSQYCGLPGFQLECHDGQYPIIRFEELEFRVLDIDKYHHIMTISRLDLLNIVRVKDPVGNAVLISRKDLSACAVTECNFLSV
uniref:Wall-associated receptor kinase galacturonan-binding domain-containing protein n=1 Tax=Fagus sylvatica TaxID=28930 RepID=A0A2N9HTY4_FAGSY